MPRSCDIYSSCRKFVIPELETVWLASTMLLSINLKGISIINTFLMLHNYRITGESLHSAQKICNCSQEKGLLQNF